MRIIHLNDLKEILDYKDLRAVRNWCEQRDVFVFNSGKGDCVNQTEFELVFDRPFINHLQRKFGSDWESVYKLYKDENIKALVTLNKFDLSKKPVTAVKSKNKMINELQTKFLNHAKTA